MTIIDHITQIAEELGWSVHVNPVRSRGIREVEFSQYTNAGQDFNFEIELKGLDYDGFVKAVDSYYEGFDPDYEASLWIGDDGHGKNGAPYHISDIVKDMEDAEHMIYELLKAFENNPWKGSKRH